MESTTLTVIYQEKLVRSATGPTSENHDHLKLRLVDLASVGGQNGPREELLASKVM
jgi:hypothetical protein